MENDILRVENFKDADESVNSSHFKNNKNITSLKASKNSIMKLIYDEKVDFKSHAIENSKLAPKPKLFSSIILALSLFVANLILAVTCFVTKEISFAVACAVLFSITVPLSLTYFFYRLDTRSNFSFLNVLKTFAVGALAFGVLEIAFKKLIPSTLQFNNLVVIAKSLIDMAVVLIITILFYKQGKKTGAITLMFIACTVASGFSTFKSFLTTFDSLFIKVQIFDGQSMSVGAIINTGEWANRSMTALFKTLFYHGFYTPLMFTMLNVIIGFSLNYYFNKTARESENGTSNLFVIIICILINALISVGTSIRFFEIVYNVCAVLFTAYMIYEVLDYSIKNEKYEE